VRTRKKILVSIRLSCCWGVLSDRAAGIWFRDPETGSFPVDAENNVLFSKYVDPKPAVWTG
jgi:hypothetical protein